MDAQDKERIIKERVWIVANAGSLPMQYDDRLPTVLYPLRRRGLLHEFAPCTPRLPPAR